MFAVEMSNDDTLKKFVNKTLIVTLTARRMLLTCGSARGTGKIARNENVTLLRERIGCDSVNRRSPSAICGVTKETDVRNLSETTLMLVI